MICQREFFLLPVNLYFAQLSVVCFRTDSSPPSFLSLRFLESPMQFRCWAVFFCAVPGLFYVTRELIESFSALNKAAPGIFQRIRAVKVEISSLKKRQALLVNELAKSSAKFKEEERKRLQKFPEYWHPLAAVRFEKAVAQMLEDAGYQTSLTKASGDGGIDVIAKNREKTFYIQCKGWAKPVGAPVIREIAGVVGVVKTNGSVIAVVAASNGFTKEAKAFASQSGVALWDARILASMAP